MKIFAKRVHRPRSMLFSHWTRLANILDPFSFYFGKRWTRLADILWTRLAEIGLSSRQRSRLSISLSLAMSGLSKVFW